MGRKRDLLVFFKAYALMVESRVLRVYYITNLEQKLGGRKTSFTVSLPSQALIASGRVGRRGGKKCPVSHESRRGSTSEQKAMSSQKLQGGTVPGPFKSRWVSLHLKSSVRDNGHLSGGWAGKESKVRSLAATLPRKRGRRAHEEMRLNYFSAMTLRVSITIKMTTEANIC
jgi:hypothetical protein